MEKRNVTSDSENENSDLVGFGMPERNINPQIENAFTYHAPKEGQPAKYQAIREKAKQLAYLIEELVPDSRERSLAMTKLEECTMWANAGIARN